MRKPVFAATTALGFVAAAALAQQHDHSMDQHDQPVTQAADTHGAAASPDERQVVQFPQALRERTLANMRDHLLALQQIQQALSTEDYDKAADIAEQRLGMTSLKLHGSHEVAKYMPPGMQNAGTAMHRSASHFALVAQEASATREMKPVLAALSRIAGNCVACHAGYRVK